MSIVSTNHKMLYLKASDGSFSGVTTDETLTGNGTSASPLGVNESALAPSEAELYIQANSGELDEVSDVVQSNSANWNTISSISGKYVPLTADPCTIGLNNSAGSNALAQGSFNYAWTQSFAQGHNNSAGGHSLAQGLENFANNHGFTQGEFNYAQEYAFSQGNDNSAEHFSFTQGTRNSAANKSFAEGERNSATYSSLAQGNLNSATNYSLAQGESNTAFNKSLAQGILNSATNHSLAQGSDNSAEYDSFSQGEYNSARNNSFAQGFRNSATYHSLAQGNSNSAYNHSQAFGDHTIASNTGMAIGAWNKTSSAPFVIGNGTGETSRSDLFVIYRDGSVSAQGKISANGVELELSNYIPYTASGVELPNSHFKIDTDGRAYKLAVVNSAEQPLNNNFFQDRTLSYPFGKGKHYIVNVPSDRVKFTVNENGAYSTMICSGVIQNGVCDFVYPSSGITGYKRFYTYTDEYTPYESLTTANCKLYYFKTISASDEYALISDLEQVSADITATIPSTAGLASESYVQTNSAVLTGMIDGKQDTLTFGYDEQDRINSINNSALAGGGDVVSHDNTLSGTGMADSPLGVVNPLPYPVEFVATSAAATGTNILYVVTGTGE